MKKKPLIIAAVLILLLAGFFGFRSSYIVVNGNVFPRNAAELDLRDKALTVEEYDQISAALPDCQIRWLVPFQDITPLLELENLQNIWVCGWILPEDQLNMLHEAFPNARIVEDSTRSTGAGWRDLPNDFAQQDLLDLWYMTTP